MTVCQIWTRHGNGGVEAEPEEYGKKEKGMDVVEALCLIVGNADEVGFADV